MVNLLSWFKKVPVEVAQPVPAKPKPVTPPPDIRHPLKKDALKVINAMGLTVETVIDVGVQTGTGELMLAFPDAFHLLIEPIEEWEPQITKGYTRSKIAHEIVIAGAAEIDGELTLEMASVVDKYAITHARFADKTTANETRTVPVRTVDGLVAERDLKQPYLVKIDVDGAETRVLEGALATLKSSSIVIIEAQTENFMERAAPILAAGFELFDVVDLCYYDNRLAEMDLIFVKQQTTRESNHGIYQGEFDPQKWKPYKP